MGYATVAHYLTRRHRRERDVAIALGNLLSIYARNDFGVKKSIQYLKQSGIWEDLKGYYRVRGRPDSDI